MLNQPSRSVRIRALILFSSLLSVVAISALAAVASDHHRGLDANEQPAQGRTAPAREPGQPGRTVFRHSVVPGGVLTADEVEAAISGDEIVAAHYSAIDPRKLRVETVREDRAVYMSYRIGDKVFWTKHKVRLREGETILTDGAHEIRTRCGNCIALAPMEPTSDDEPGEMEFDALTDELEVLQSRNPLGSELLLGPVGGIPLQWLLGDSAGGFEGTQFTGGPQNGITAFGYTSDRTDPRVSDIDLVLFPLNGDEPASPDFQLADEPFTHIPPHDPHDSGKPQHPGGPGHPEVPVIPFPPVDNPVVPVPEPATLLLIGSGLTTLFARRRRR